MNKCMLLLSFLALGFLTAMGSLNPDNATVWLSSQTQTMEAARIGIMAVLFALIVTTPPRNVILRYVVGVTSVGLIATSGYMTYQNMMQALDGIAFIAAGISALVAALEIGLIEEKKAKKQITDYRYLAPAA